SASQPSENFVQSAKPLVSWTSSIRLFSAYTPVDAPRTAIAAAQERSIVFPVMLRPFTPVACTLPLPNAPKRSDAMVTSLAPEAATTPTTLLDHPSVTKAVRLTVIALDVPSMETEPTGTPYWAWSASESRVMPVEP